MPVITSVLGTATEMAGMARGEDAIRLTSEERASAHMAAFSEGGRRVKISLPRGTELNDGDVLAIEGDTMIVVRAAPELLFAVAPQTARMWGTSSGWARCGSSRPWATTPPVRWSPVAGR